MAVMPYFFEVCWLANRNINILIVILSDNMPYADCVHVAPDQSVQCDLRATLAARQFRT